MKRLVRKVDPVPFTKDGYEALKVEKEALLKERAHAVKELTKARELGDLRENGYYKAARQKLNQVDGRLNRLSFMLQYGVIVEATQSESVQIGSTVVLKDDKGEITYTIVGQEEANPAERKISVKSPLGQSLVGRKVNEKVNVLAPAGVISYTISSIS